MTVREAKWFVAGIGIAALIACASWWKVGDNGLRPLSLVPPNITRGYVTKASDGDTLHVLVDGNKPVTVRVLGVDTPETHDPRKPVQCYGPEASAFTKGYATNRVTLTTEPSSGDVTDRYGRTLAYVYVQAHRADLGAVLIRRGYAKVYAYGNRHFARRVKYERLEAAAKSYPLGRWKECP